MRKIHKLSPDDLTLMRSMLDLFGLVFDEKAVYCDSWPDDKYWASLLSKSHVIALVCLIDDQVVGGLVAYELEKLEQERSELYIYDLAVLAPFRRQGVATDLINTVRVEATARNAHVVFVQADYGDDPAIRLYSKLGAREDVMHFDIQPASS